MKRDARIALTAPRLWATGAAMLCALALPASGQDYTHLVDVRAGSSLSQLVRDAVFLDQIYSDGSQIDMAPW